MWFKARLNVMFIIHVRDELKVLLPLGLGIEICKYVEFFFMEFLTSPVFSM